MKHEDAKRLSEMDETACGEDPDGRELREIGGEQAERFERIHEALFHGGPVERRRARGDPAPSAEAMEEIHERLFGEGGTR